MLVIGASVLPTAILQVFRGLTTIEGRYINRGPDNPYHIGVWDNLSDIFGKPVGVGWILPFPMSRVGTDLGYRCGINERFGEVAR